MGDEDLKLQLEEWQFQELYPRLKEAGIGLAELAIIEEPDLDKLFPKFSELGKKIIFRHKLAKLKKNANQQEKVNNWVSTIKCFNVAEVDVKAILEKTPSGQDTLEYFQQNSTLEPQHQQIICNAVIDYCFAEFNNLRIHDLEAIASAICKNFPGEVDNTYFSRSSKQKPGGKLYDRYFNLRRKRRKRAGSPGTPSSFSTLSFAADNLIEDIDEIDESIARSCQSWLKFNDSPREEILEKWKTTYTFRRKNKDKNLFTEWPIYKNASLGPELIAWDFNQLYINKSFNFFQLWEKFVPRIEKYMTRNIKDKTSRELLAKLDCGTINSDSRSCIIVLLLNALMTPTASFKENGIVKKVTIKEAIDCTILHIDNISKLEEEILEVRNRFLRNNGTLQPIIVVVGTTISTLSEFYVYCDGIIFKFPSFLKSFDTCFQIFHVFDYEYPVYCKAVWTFVQLFFYKFETKFDDKLSKISGLISHLQNLVE